MKKRQPVWQARLDKPATGSVLDFTSSVSADNPLIPYDLACGLAHVKMLVRQKMISTRDSRRLVQGLRRLLVKDRGGRMKLGPEFEDVHMNVEQQLRELIGPVADVLHTARSRNDLIATDLRLYCRSETIRIMRDLVTLERALIDKASQHARALMPGYTHWQPAQPITVSFYLLAHFSRFDRDFQALEWLLGRIAVSPLGSGALAGTSLPIDLEHLAAGIGLRSVVSNALDGVADRDFLCDLLYYLARIMIHISGLAEELIIFSTDEFQLVRLDDSVTTGSSIMPQKRNPDVCELLRAKAGRAIGNLTGALSILKGLSVSYNRDLQELKPLLLDQVKEASSSLALAGKVIRGLEFKVPEQWGQEPGLGCASDLVDQMVMKGWRFRHAYRTVATCVRRARGDIKTFTALVAAATKLPAGAITHLLKPETSVRAKRTKNSTGLKPTRQQLRHARHVLAQNVKRLSRLEKTNRL